MRPPNVLVVLSDEHTAAVAEWAGHPHVRTPHLDQLAAQGVSFDRAYTNSPMCVPSRLSLMAGQYVHQIGAWDNGVIPRPSFRTWDHHLREAGYTSVIAGRTHFNGPDRLLGFDCRLTDDLDFWLDHSGRPPRRTTDWRRPSNSHVTEHGPGDHLHTRHDVAATDAALDFLRDPGPDPSCCTSVHASALPIGGAAFVPRSLRSGRRRAASATDDEHPVLSLLRHGFRNDEPLTEEELREATVCYWALISHLDQQIGRLLAAVPDDTVVIYTSDHGEMAGHHGIWQKQCFYEPAVRIPLLLAPSVGATRAERRSRQSGRRILPTLRDIAGLPPDPALPGRTLLDPVDRPVLSEYHAQGMVDGGFMLKSGPWKYCYYGAAQRPQVFNVDTDPLEMHDLSTDEALVAKLDSELRSIVDPDQIDVLANSDEAERLATLTRG